MVPSDADAAVQTDLQALFAATPGFAASQLESGNTFFPYAAHLGHDDRIGLMATELGEQPTEQEMIHALTETLRMGADELRATAVVSNSDAESAIVVHLEHRDGVSVRIAIPYTREGASATVHEPGDVEPVPGVVFV